MSIRRSNLGVTTGMFLLEGILIIWSLTLWQMKPVVAFVVSTNHHSPCRWSSTHCELALPTWGDLEGELQLNINSQQLPVSVDSALDPVEPDYSTDRPTLFRERHGWCPYSERVWLTLEVLGVDYDTIRIDNTGPGRKPPYFGGKQTPQLKWPQGDLQGESMDLVQELNKRYSTPTNSLYPDNTDLSVEETIGQFRTIFPSQARPSSRAAFLFGWNGDALSKNELERVLEETNDLLGQTKGPFFCGNGNGNRLTAADVAWAPFLERYRAQLPCLHASLDPDSPTHYPHLHAWYEAMDHRVPAYICRVKGDASSWRKVLTMAGFGNAGSVPPDIGNRMNQFDHTDQQVPAILSPDETKRQTDLWTQYASTRPHLAKTPWAEAAAVLTRNRHAICRDVQKRNGTPWDTQQGLPMDDTELDETLRALAQRLMENNEQIDHGNNHDAAVQTLASFLDERMCVPRDMGCLSAAAMKRIASKLN
eukprot:scaffold659517_cov59-Attheya_sp.AAC.1